MEKIPAPFQNLFSGETKAFANLATVMTDGSPQVTPLWFSMEGDHLLVNSARGRTKDQNMRARPRVALAISDPGNPYRYIQVRGTVVEIKEEGAWEHINSLSEKYDGKPFPKKADQVRVIYKIRIDRVTTNG